MHLTASERERPEVISDAGASEDHFPDKGAGVKRRNKLPYMAIESKNSLETGAPGSDFRRGSV
ncbi:MAG: hypothetical protein NC548_09340 [Lachnospiraceae bacterium]|nr:hypothetical protein [Lachnospiraceae bacterium]